jgi:serine protease AprX
MDAAAEILWFNGIVVVASSGNIDPAAGFNTINAAPANDPYLIVVGASHEQGTPARADDLVTDFSGQGLTLDGFTKPDLVAPGKDIISVLSSGSDWYYEYTDRAVLDKQYFRISGTSMAAPMVTGAVALLLQAEPDLTPNQVKYRLMATAGSIPNATGQAYPYLDVYAALTTPTTAAANQGIIPHQLLAKMALMAYWTSENGGDTIDWGSVNWDSVNWDSVNWDSVNWDSVNWDSVNWDSVNWDSVNWDSVNWDSVNWDSVNWNSVNWNSVNWNSVNWNSVNWNSVDFNN